MMALILAGVMMVMATVALIAGLKSRKDGFLIISAVWVVGSIIEATLGQIVR